MAETKNKTILQRPMIIVSLTTAKWKIAKEDDVIRFYNSKGNEVHPKQETLEKGLFHVCWVHGWREEPILPNNTVSTYWQCTQQEIEFKSTSYKDILARGLKYQKTHPGDILIVREKETYFNPKTKETTDDEKVAANWFKGKKPLWISSASTQKIGLWVDGGDGYVDVKFYYNNRIQREGCNDWKEGEQSGVRIHKDGKISHFWKGKYYDSYRPFETEKVSYRSFDPRFKGLQRLTSLFLDLRSERLIGSDSINRFLCAETKEIMKKSGLPEQYWCWGSRKRPFSDTYDLINFITHVQHKDQTKKGQTIDEFLKDKPFNEDNLVLKCNKGIILRLPGYHESWVDNKGNHYDHEPSKWETSDPKPKIKNCLIYERYRIWISDNGKKHTCQELIHEGECWSSIRWDSINWPRMNNGKWDMGYSSSVPGDEKRQHLVELRKQAAVMYNKMCGKAFGLFIKTLPALIRYQEFLKAHVEFAAYLGISRLLDSIYKAPKLTETLIKLGYGDWFYNNGKHNRYYGHERDEFNLYNIFIRFGLRDDSYGYSNTTRPGYEEKAGNTLYQNLQVTKEQFNWIAKLQYPGDFMDIVRGSRILIPGKQGAYYEAFKDIPVKYLEIINKCIAELLARGIESWEVTRKITDLLQRYQCTPVDLEKIIAKRLDLSMLIDYLRMREECRQLPENEGFNIANWDKIPTDPRDLAFSHNRLMAFYNLVLANRERWYREAEEKRMIERQKLYVERYKKLKTLAYSEKEDDRCIVVPEKLIELVVEGQVLHHCVGSFATSVAEGRDTIVFLRHKDQPETPYATISLLPRGKGWYIDQAHTAHNGCITEEDVSFLKRWGAKHEIEQSSIRVSYGAKCHH